MCLRGVTPEAIFYGFHRWRLSRNVRPTAFRDQVQGKLGAYNKMTYHMSLGNKCWFVTTPDKGATFLQQVWSCRTPACASGAYQWTDTRGCNNRVFVCVSRLCQAFSFATQINPSPYSEFFFSLFHKKKKNKKKLIF